MKADPTGFIPRTILSNWFVGHVQLNLVIGKVNCTSATQHVLAWWSSIFSAVQPYCQHSGRAPKNYRMGPSRLDFRTWSQLQKCIHFRRLYFQARSLGISSVPHYYVFFFLEAAGIYVPIFWILFKANLRKLTFMLCILQSRLRRENVWLKPYCLISAQYY